MFRFLQTDHQTDRAVEIIRAIGSTWPLILILIITLFTIIYRKGISQFFSRLNKVSGKTGPIELKFEKEQVIALDEKVEISTGNEDAQKAQQTEKITSEESEADFYDVYEAVTQNKLDKSKLLFESIQGKETDPIQKSKNDLLYLYIKYQYAGIDTVREIEKISESSKNITIQIQALRYLGDCFLKGKQFNEAEEKYREAYNLSSTEDEKIEPVIEIADCLFESGKKEDAINYLKNIKTEFTKTTYLAKIYSKLSKYYDKMQNWLERCLATELAVAHDPTNKNFLFDAGYAYSDSYKSTDNKIAHLSILHYKELVSFSEHSAGYNNLGVAYGNFDLQNKCVMSYKKSVELSGSLAASNLAYKYINQGFFEDAKMLLNKVKEEKDVHENVWSALRKLDDELKKENEKENEIIELAKTCQRFLRKFSYDFFAPECEFSQDLSGNWKIISSEVVIKTLSNLSYSELVWTDEKFKYTISANTKKCKAVICDGEYVKKDGGLITKLIGFLIFNDTKIEILLYEKSNSNAFLFTALKNSA